MKSRGDLPHACIKCNLSECTTVNVHGVSIAQVAYVFELSWQVIRTSERGKLKSAAGAWLKVSSDLLKSRRTQTGKLTSKWPARLS